MGGFGSGRRGGRTARNTTDNYRAIDVRRWQREKLLTLPIFNLQWTRFGQLAACLIARPEADRVYLIDRFRISPDKWKVERSIVRLDWTPCHYGGRRAWFLCPHCRRRVAILHGSTAIACRHCFRLAYASTRENTGQRAERRAEKIRSRLKWHRGIAWGMDEKPRHMHWDTFNRLSDQAAELAAVAWESSLRRFRIKRAL